MDLRGIGTLSGGGTSLNFFLSYRKGSTLKGKNLLPREANSFLLEQTPFQNEANLFPRKEFNSKIFSL